MLKCNALWRSYDLLFEVELDPRSIQDVPLVLYDSRPAMKLGDHGDIEKGAPLLKLRQFHMLAILWLAFKGYVLTRIPLVPDLDLLGMT